MFIILWLFIYKKPKRRKRTTFRRKKVCLINSTLVLNFESIGAFCRAWGWRIMRYRALCNPWKWCMSFLFTDRSLRNNLCGSHEDTCFLPLCSLLAPSPGQSSTKTRVDWALIPIQQWDHLLAYFLGFQAHQTKRKFYRRWFLLFSVWHQCCWTWGNPYWFSETLCCK